MKVLGSGKERRFTGYTLSFRLPALDCEFAHQTVHERCRTSLWRMCRGCLGTEDTFVYHVDCFHAIERHYGRRLSLDDLWEMSVWTQGLPRMPTISASRPRAGARLEVDGTKTNDTWIRILGALPQELIDQIRGMCPESCLWRYFSALERFPHLEPLLDRDTGTRWLSFEELGYWNRWDGVMSTSGSADLVRLSLDDLGIRSVEHKSATDGEGTSPDSGIGYVVEHVDTMKSCKYAIKVREFDHKLDTGRSCMKQGQFIRLMPVDDRPPATTCTEGLRIWDIPNPPPVKTITWFSERLKPAKVSCLKLQGLRGLTVFCSQGAIYAIRPHYTWGISAAPAPSQANLHPAERKRLTPIFFPLRDGEKISEIWVRDCTCAASVCRKTIHNEALAVRPCYRLFVFLEKST